MPAQTPDRPKRACEAHAGPFNCAQAVAVAFQDLYGLTPQQIDNHKRNGGGRAPGGLCGALHASLELLADDTQRNAVTAQFAGRVGSTQCREIRQAKQISCSRCVETAATILVEVLAAGDKAPSNTLE